MNDQEREVLATKLWAHVDRSGGPDACWPWTGGGNQYNYGVLRVPGGWDQAHRVAYSLEVGTIRHTIDHACHTEACTVPPRECPHRRCCNPAHMQDVTRGANAARANRSRPRKAA